ncbi:hypothetical protein VNO80_16553 [Phaseolus coccineus]|uniref:CAP N-terminal domain-containing protein n=1 Tax=Phaseolus coccineus TaxID=3886 RepID=A0AAN9MMD6_PHACN
MCVNCDVGTVVEIEALTFFKLNLHDPVGALHDPIESSQQFSCTAKAIGGQVLDVSKIVQEAFDVEKELLIKLKLTQKLDLAGFGDFLKPLNEVITKATNLTKGRKSYFFNHLKADADSLSALAWIA